MTNTEPRAPGVHFATYRDDDTGQVTPLFLRSHDEIDTEIEQRIRTDRSRAALHEVTRSKFHAALVADSRRLEVRGLSKKACESAVV
jgi:hypothetical protein